MYTSSFTFIIIIIVERRNSLMWEFYYGVKFYIPIDLIDTKLQSGEVRY